MKIDADSYEIGYAEGERSANADWQVALEELTDLPGTIDGPAAAVAAINALMRAAPDPMQSIELGMREVDSGVPGVQAYEGGEKSFRHVRSIVYTDADGRIVFDDGNDDDEE